MLRFVGGSFCTLLAEGTAVYNAHHIRRETIALESCILCNRSNGWLVKVFNTATQRIRHEVFGKGTL